MLTNLPQNAHYLNTKRNDEEREKRAQNIKKNQQNEQKSRVECGPAANAHCKMCVCRIQLVFDISTISSADTHTEEESVGTQAVEGERMASVPLCDA